MSTNIPDHLLQESSVASLESSIRWADGFLLLYSITQRVSFLEVPRLKRLIDQTKHSLGRELASRRLFWLRFCLSSPFFLFLTTCTDRVDTHFHTW